MRVNSMEVVVDGAIAALIVVQHVGSEQGADSADQDERERQEDRHAADGTLRLRGHGRIVGL